MLKSRTYKGQHIRPCEDASGQHRGRWMVQTYHRTGNPWSDEYCPHYHTLAEARAGITELIRVLWL